MAWAVVTGASSGLGAEYARQLADEGYDIVLVARRREALDLVADDVRNRGRRAEVLVADLAKKKDVDRVATRISSTRKPVDYLVNNAGYGLGRSFRASTRQEHYDSLHVMVTAVMALSHAAAQAMTERGSGTILNVSSIASALVRSTYSAHKAWVVVFSEALSRDLARFGVQVTAVRPGLVRTGFHAAAGIDFDHFPKWVWIPGEQVVAESLKAARRGRAVVTPSLRYSVISWLLSRTPRSLLRKPRRTKVGS